MIEETASASKTNWYIKNWYQIWKKGYLRHVVTDPLILLQMACFDPSFTASRIIWNGRKTVRSCQLFYSYSLKWKKFESFQVSYLSDLQVQITQMKMKILMAVGGLGAT